MMKKVHFLVNKSKIVNYLISPVRHNKKKLLERGYKIKFFYSPSERCFSCDILLLVSKTVLTIVKENKAVISEPSPTIDLLHKAIKYANKIVWIDDSDSTTVTHFELLPYIDLYLKKQLFIDKKLYKKEFVGGRIFTDYYHKEFGIEDDIKFDQFYPLDLSLEKKVSLSWNIGLGDMYNSFTKKYILQVQFPEIFSANYKIDYVSPNYKKELDIFIRTTSDLNRNLVAFHRKEFLKRLEAVIDQNKLEGSIKGEWLSNKNYRDALRNTKILPSPFGWGEIGVRDYEAFIFGAALLKPDISQMVTWPDIFIAGETYQPFRWDFEDLESAILELLNNEKKRIQIANNGQQAYKDSISSKGMEQFCDWFIQQIEQ